MAREDTRQISFAHFATPNGGRNLPTLKVLGWDSRDTALRLDAVAKELTERLAWPDDENDADGWRKQWRTAFTLRHREVITTSRDLSVRLAGLAREIRDRIQTALAIETEDGRITKLMKAFQETLVHDLDADDFADMYAQTIAYGLLSARIADPHKKTADDFAGHMRTNPFLRDLMETFLQVGGGRPSESDLSNMGGAGIDFDELGVAEVVELLDNANMEAVIKDFGDRNPQEDPVIHFYELFLKEYDAEKRMERGVFYTPRPVVSYIVRSVDELLRTEFGLADGLADTTTWGEMVQLHNGLNIPEGIPPEQAFVQILDPATGTGTFLVEAIDVIRGTLIKKWRAQGLRDSDVEALWNEYVPRHLLPRLHGYELLMAPYAIAHLKIGLKLYETGYRFDSEERAQVYLTNALEPAYDFSGQMDFAIPALAYEAQAVNEVKDGQQFTVVIGNPPYAGHSSNRGNWIRKSVEDYKQVDGRPLGEKNPKWLQDDYVKFLRFSQWNIEQAGHGVVGKITNHSYLDNPTFRGMRQSLTHFFDDIYILDLHGNANKGETCPDGGPDKNVFDIRQGVAIAFFVRYKQAQQVQLFDHRPTPGDCAELANGEANVHHAGLYGARESKYDWLGAHDRGSTGWDKVNLVSPFYLFMPRDETLEAEYRQFISIPDLFPVNSVGVVTARDGLTIRWSEEEVWDTVRTFSQLDAERARQEYQLGKDAQDWKVTMAQQDLLDSGPTREKVAPILYRPFDVRHTYYTGQSRGFICRPRSEVMRHMLAGENLALITPKIHKGEFGALATQFIGAHKSVAAYDINYYFPLYLYPGVGKAAGSLFSRWSKGKGGRTPNLESGFVDQLEAVTELRFVSDGRGELRYTLGPEDILAWIYAVLHSPGYRGRYEAQLRLDFPRVPLPGSVDLFRELAEAGHDLLDLHLLESPKLRKRITSYTGPRNPGVGRVGWSEGTVWLSAGKTNAREGHRATKPGTIGFHGVPEEVWDFLIGGYQVCHKWLKDRKGHTLSDENVAYYQKIIVALNETIRIMAEIDEVIEAHGGWPDAFQTGSGADAAS